MRSAPTPDDLLAELIVRGMAPLAEAIARDAHVCIEEVLSTDRSRSIARARKRLIAGLRVAYDLSYPDLGRLLALHHTTCLHAVRTCDVDPRALVARLAPAEPEERAP